MIRHALTAAAFVAAAAPGFSTEAEARSNKPSASLVIADGHTGRILYDDGYDDLFCVTRRRFAGYDWRGRPVFRRTIRCR